MRRSSFARKIIEKQRGDSAMVGRETRGLYIISVASRLLEMHPQTLRKYERVGLIAPSRTIGMLRLYSSEDIMRLRMIKYLVEEKRLNLAGVELAMALASKLIDMQREMADSASGDEIFDKLRKRITETLEMLGIF